MILVLGILVVLFAVYELYLMNAPRDSVAGWAKNAGFSGVDLGIAVAIAFAESSGDTNAVGDVDLGRSIGLWQINLAAHPEYSEQELFNPQNNADAAFAIYRQAGNTFRPWTTFKTGAYLSHMDSPVSFGSNTEES